MEDEEIARVMVESGFALHMEVITDLSLYLLTCRFICLFRCHWGQ